MIGGVRIDQAAPIVRHTVGVQIIRGAGCTVIAVIMVDSLGSTVVINGTTRALCSSTFFQITRYLPLLLTGVIIVCPIILQLQTVATLCVFQLGNSV